MPVNEYVVKSGLWLDAHAGPLGFLSACVAPSSGLAFARQRDTARQMLESLATSFDLAEDVHRLDDIAADCGERLESSGGDYDDAIEFLRRIAQEVER
jgi:hypothetical protein